MTVFRLAEGENAMRPALDQAVILEAQLQSWGSMAKAHDAEYCTYARAKNVATPETLPAESNRTLVQPE